MNGKKVQIRTPKFEQYQLVTLYWNSQERPTQVVRRWFDMDDGAEGHWWYKLAGDEQLYPEGALELRRNE